MSCVRIAPGVAFTTVAPAGVHILAALDYAAQRIGTSLTITSACDGEHSGPDDPHYRGEAYDVRSHDFADVMKPTVLDTIMQFLGGQFYGFLESPGLPNEHFHIQLAKGATYA